MSYPQQVFTPQPQAGYVVSPPPVVYSAYPQMTNMQSYHPSVQPSVAQQQQMGYYQGGQNVPGNNDGCTECCMSILCLGACTLCCFQCCGGGGDECC